MITFDEFAEQFANFKSVESYLLKKTSPHFFYGIYMKKGKKEIFFFFNAGTSFFYFFILFIYLCLTFHTSALNSFLQFIWLNIDVWKFLEHLLSTLKMFKP